MNRNINDQFLETFIQFERHMRSIYGDQVNTANNQTSKDYESSINDIIKYVYNKKLDPVISVPMNKSIIDSARKFRNVVEHEGQIAIVSDTFLASFQKVVENVMSTKTVQNKMIPISKLQVANTESTVGELISIMNEGQISNIPIIENNILKGVFSEVSLYHAFLKKNELIIDLNTKIYELFNAIDIDGMQSIYYDFIGRDVPLLTCYKKFMKGNNIKTQKRLELIFVTHSGKHSESILGLITLWDLQELFDIY